MRHSMPVNIRFYPHYPIMAPPTYATPGAAGCDLILATKEPLRVTSQPVLAPTGISIEVPQGFEAQVRPRSGLAAKHGLICVNSPGTIDSDYRGEIKVILYLLPHAVYTDLGGGVGNTQIHPGELILNPGDRIAQLVLAPVWRAEWNLVESLGDTVRGAGGFGSTGAS